MKWRDLLFFSKGERQALTLLLSLIAIAWMAIVYTEFSQNGSKKMQAIEEIKADTIRYFPASETTEKKTELAKEKTTQKNTTKHIAHPIKTIHQPIKGKRFSHRPSNKYPKGTVIELNAADTTALKKVPGIGSVFAKRICRYRKLMGGFYSVEQLSEVYGIDADRYKSLHTWFTVDPKKIDSLEINQLSAKRLAVHPYINDKQAIIIEKMVSRKGKLKDWNDLILLEEFSDFDIKRLTPYVSFR